MRAYGQYFPATVIDGVEIDGELLEHGAKWFGLRDRPKLRLHTEDARPFLRRTDGRFDAIFVDAYRQPYIPFYLTTREFFALARERLSPGGVGRRSTSGTRALRQAREGAVGDAAAPLPARRARPGRRRQHAADRVRRGAVARDARAAALAFPRTCGRSRWRPPRDSSPPLRGGDVYTDDHAPVEWLVDASIVQEAAGGEDK